MQLHFKGSGHGRAVILLHGLFGSSDNWQTIALRLAETFHVFALDQRNHGQSPHSAEMDYPLMAADVDEFFSAHGLESALVIGHSMGGTIALYLAEHHPADLKKIKQGSKLSPVLLVQGDPLWIADGYHRICVSYHIDEKEEVLCRIVPHPKSHD